MAINTLERTLVIMKPDALKRGLVGNILSRFENVGLKLVACRMVRAERYLLEKHYPANEDYWRNLGSKTKKTYEDLHYDVKEILGSDDELQLGKDVHEKLINYMMDGPVVLTVWEGTGAVQVVRKMVGSTVPLLAEQGTIRGDFSHDSQLSAPLKGRPLNTIVHASGNLEEAKFEIGLWFGNDFQPSAYIRTDEYFF